MGSPDVDVTSPDGPAGPPAPRAPSEEESLLAQLHSFLGRRYPAFVVVLALSLASLLALAAYAQGASAQRGGWHFWMFGLSPVMLVYILAVHPFMHRRWQRAMDSLEALAPDAGGAVRAERRSRRG